MIRQTLAFLAEILLGLNPRVTCTGCGERFRGWNTAAKHGARVHGWSL